jgi:hypothetical protein
MNIVHMDVYKMYLEYGSIIPMMSCWGYDGVVNTLSPIYLVLSLCLVISKLHAYQEY